MQTEIMPYLDTAYNSRAPRQLSKMNRENASYAEKQVRKHPVPIQSRECREFLGISHGSLLIDELKMIDKSEINSFTDDQIANGINQKWETLKNPAAILRIFNGILLFWLIAGAGSGSIIMLFVEGFNQFWIKMSLLLFGVPFLIYKLSNIALNRHWITDKNNTTLNRHTGMISFVTKDKGRIELPFDEFDPYLSIGTRPTGSSDYYLRLIHHYSDYFVTQPNSYNSEWEAYQGWETLHQFMDISRPLPDIPEFELYRPYDQTTIEYDRINNRPKGYWKTVSEEDADKWHDASRKAARGFPWGSTREDALRQGWEPSGVAERDWTRIHNVDEETLTPTPIREWEAL